MEKYHKVFGKVSVISTSGDYVTIKTEQGNKEVHRCMLTDKEVAHCKCKIPKGWFADGCMPNYPLTYAGGNYNGYYKYDHICGCGNKYNSYAFVYSEGNGYEFSLKSEDL